MSKMISTTSTGLRNQQEEKQSKYMGPAAIESNVLNINGQNGVTTQFVTDDQQTASRLSNGIGGLFKRLSPKYRSRSKSPAANTHNRIEKSWVTVEIKDYPQHQQPSVARAGMGNYSSAATSSSSPSSPVLRNGGSMTPDKSPRLRGALGNLFHRNSMKKTRDSSSAQKPSKIEIRTKSEHELNGGGLDIGGMGITSIRSADLAGGDWKFTSPNSIIATQRLAKENGGDIRDSMRWPGAESITTRGTLSEEDLVSKSLSRERGDIHSTIVPRGIMSGQVQSSVPAALTTSTVYHSQDSVFDSPSRMPSYVRISCTLSGYRNYRNVDLKAGQSPKQTRTPVKSDHIAVMNVQPSQPSPSIVPFGKSIVERRLEKFENPVPRQIPATNAAPPKEQSLPDGAAHTPTPIKSLISSFNKMSIHDAVTATPVKDLISNFTKMNVHDSASPVNGRPRQKPPPIPPKRLCEKIDVENENTLPVLSILEETPEFYQSKEDIVKNGGDQRPVLDSENDGGEKLISAPSPVDVSTSIELVMNGIHRVILQTDNVAVTVAHKAAEAVVEGAVKQVPASFLQSQRVLLQNGNFTSFEDKAIVSGGSMVRDGLYYQNEAARERKRLETLCGETEVELNTPDVPDEALERIRMAVGRVRLLLSKKFAKFEELIEKNLNPTPDDPRPTHVSDLEGYYDLVKMEIEDIDACFDIVKRMKDNHWLPVPIDETDQQKVIKRDGPVASKGRQPQQQKRNGKEPTNARSEAARQRLKEAKEAAKQKKMQTEVEAVSEIGN